MLKFGDTYLNFGGTYLSGWKGKPIYNVNLTVGPGGTATAFPISGYQDTVVTLSNTPDTNNDFVRYDIEGASLYDTNKFNLTNDVNVSAIFAQHFNDTVTIGNQTWMSKNLSIDDGGSGVCHKNITAAGSNLNTQYLYTWGAANRIADSIPGWHLPTMEEWNTLFNYIGGTASAGRKLKATYSWNKPGSTSTDEYGFSVLGVGFSTKVQEPSEWIAIGQTSYMWSKTSGVNKYGTNCGYEVTFLYGDKYVMLDSASFNCGGSVRLVRD